MSNYILESRFNPLSRMDVLVILILAVRTADIPILRYWATSNGPWRIAERRLGACQKQKLLAVREIPRTQVLNSPITSISPLSSLTSSANRCLWPRTSSSNTELRSAQLWETFPRTPCCPGVILQRLLGSNIVICSICTEAVSRNRCLLDTRDLLTCVSS